MKFIILIETEKCNLDFNLAIIHHEKAVYDDTNTQNKNSKTLSDALSLVTAGWVTFLEQSNNASLQVQIMLPALQFYSENQMI